MPNSISKHRLAAFNRQEGRCYYCGFPMWLENPENFAAQFNISEAATFRFRCTAEHLLPRQDGGTDSGDNIAAACWTCNITRHRISSPPDPTTYRKHVVRRVRVGKWHPRSIHHLLASSTRTGNNAMG